MCVGGTIPGCAVVEIPEPNQLRLFAGQSEEHHLTNLRLGSLTIPDAEFVDLAIETAIVALNDEATQRIWCAAAEVRKREGEIIGGNEHAIEEEVHAFDPGSDGN